MRIGRSPTRLISEITIDANIDMDSKKLTDLAAGSASGHSVRYQDVIKQALLETRGDIIFRGESVAEALGKGDSGQYLKQGTNVPEWGAGRIEDVLTTTGDIVYEGSSSAARLGKGDEGQFLRQGSTIPAWASHNILSNQLLFPVLSEETPTAQNLGTLAYVRLAHSIKHPEAIKIARIGVSLFTITLNPGTFYCEIWDDSAGDPNAVITNGSASIAQGSIVKRSVNWFVFSTAPELTADTLYWVVLRTASGDNSNYYGVYCFDGSPTDGAGVWGVGTTGIMYSNTTWADRDPPIDIIMGRAV